MHEILGFCLTLAALRHGISVHHAVFMSNHVHLVVTDPDGARPAFMQDFLSLAARAFNAELGRRENLWDNRPYNPVALHTKTDVMRKLVYAITNPVASRLVRSHRDWPGVCTLPCDMLGKPRVFGRVGRFLTAYLRRPSTRYEDRPPTLKLPITVPPQFADMRPHDFVKQLEAAVEEREAELRQHFDAKGLPFLGADRVKVQEQGAIPTSPREPLGELNPTFAAAEKQLRKALAKELKRFRAAYRQARKSWLATGHRRAVVFPAGTYLLRNRPNVLVADPIARAPS